MGVIATNTTSGILNEGESIAFAIPAGVERGDLLLVAVAFRTRAEVSSRYRYDDGESVADVKVAMIDPDGLAPYNSPTLAVEGFDFVGLTLNESPTNSSVYGGAQIRTFYRRATGQEDGASVEVTIGRGQIEPGFDPVGSVVAMGCLVIRGFHWVGDDVTIGEQVDEDFNSNPYTIGMPNTGRTIMGVSVTSFLGDFSGSPAASGWTGRWAIEEDGLAFTCFTKVDVGAATVPTAITACNQDQAPWVSGCAIIEAIGTTLNPLTLTMNPGNLRRVGFMTESGGDPGGERTATPVPYIWPVPPSDLSGEPPLAPYAPDGDPQFRPEEG